ncbi:unnamed protein product [Camellia sinensis]
MSKTTIQVKSQPFIRYKFSIFFRATVLVALFMVLALCSFYTKPWPKFSTPSSLIGSKSEADNTCHDPIDATFYDDPKLSYSIDTRMENWDEKRQEWLKHHPSFAAGAGERVLLLTGSQPSNCKNPIGDHFLLRFFKNKVDYCRIHGYDVFYNNAFMHPKMPSYWAKIPIVRATMLAHPEVEWIWWVDSDAVITDMDFKLPLERYKAHNLVVEGWPDLIYKYRSWIGVNAGVFLIRNCQWSMDFMEAWASMGPQTPNYKKWGQILKSTLKDKTYPESDDQSALIYLILKKKDRWANKIYIENEYCFQGYWESIVGTFDNVTNKDMELEKKVHGLRRRHAEKVRESYGEMREDHLKINGYGKGSGRRPFITHFTGCQPCSGNHNPMYAGDSCWKGIERALNFADNQVLRNFGFVHPNLLDSSSVSPLPFDFPSRGIDHYKSE